MQNNETNQGVMPTPSMELPLKKIPALQQSPEYLIIFSKPKVGKSSLCAELPESLLLDLENGSNKIDAVKVKASNVNEIVQWGNKILEANKPYKYLIIDTATALEEICIPYAEELYSKSAVGKKWKTEGKSEYGSVLNLPNGSGYYWLRLSFENIMNYLSTLAPRIILLAHVKDIMLEKNGIEFSGAELDLTGKLKRIVSSKSDAIGYLYRKGNKNILSFKTTDTINCGSRSAHLRNQEIEISEYDPKTNKITAYWDKIFID